MLIRDGGASRHNGEEDWICRDSRRRSVAPQWERELTKSQTLTFGGIESSLPVLRSIMSSVRLCAICFAGTRKGLPATLEWITDLDALLC